MRATAIHVFAAAGLAGAAGTAATAQVVYDNGPLSTGPIHTLGTAAPPGYVWSELQSANGTLGYAAPRYADNFTLTGTAEITAVEVFGFSTGTGTSTSPFTSGTLRIWSGRPGQQDSVVVFGDATTNRLTGSTLAMILRTRPIVAELTRPIWINHFSAGVTLPAGTYWLDWGLNAGNTPMVTVVGAAQKPGSDAIYFETSVNNWRDVVDGVSQTKQDLPFRLIGVGAGPGCAANCDESTAAPVLNVGDFTCFLQRFASGCPAPSPCYANCDNSTGTPFLNVADFTCFLQQFAAGCSTP